MGLFNIFKNKQSSIEQNDEINNEELKLNIKKKAIEIVTNVNKINVIENNNVEIQFQYLVRTPKGLQSMFILSVNGEKYYFNIAEDKFQLLDNSAKQFFDI